MDLVCVTVVSVSLKPSRRNQTRELRAAKKGVLVLSSLVMFLPLRLKETETTAMLNIMDLSILFPLNYPCHNDAFFLLVVAVDF